MSGAQITFSVGKNSIVIHRNDHYKIPRIILRGASIGMVQKFLLPIYAMGENTVLRRAMRKHYEKTNHFRLEIEVINDPNLSLFGRTKGLDYFGTDMTITGSRSSFDGVDLIVSQLDADFLQVNLATLRDPAQISKRGFADADSHIAGTIWHEIGHRYIREFSKALGGHGEVFKEVLGGSFDGLSESDILSDDVIREFQYLPGIAGGYFSDDGSKFLQERIRLFSRQLKKAGVSANTSAKEAALKLLRSIYGGFRMTRRGKKPLKDEVEPGIYSRNTYLRGVTTTIYDSEGEIGYRTDYIDPYTFEVVDTYEEVILFERDSDGKRKIDEDGYYVVVGTQVDEKGIVRRQIFEPGTLNVVDVNIIIPNNPLGVEFSDLGGLLGQQLGYRLAGNNELLGVFTSATLQTLGDNLGDVLDGLLFSSNGKANGVGEAFDVAFSEFGDELWINLKSAGIGAISSFLTAELIEAVGVDGFAGELLNSVGSAYLSAIITSSLSGTAAGVNSAIGDVNPITIIGSFLGNKLANEVLQQETIGGQIGAAVGSSLAVMALLALAGPANVGLVVVAAVAFIGNIVGGLIGSVFGGTPRSGADAVWDEEEGRFVTANAYSRKGGSKETAEALAGTVAETLNMVLDATGGRLADPAAITTGNYGMRKSDFVYRPTHTRDKHAITYRVSSKNEDAFAKITGYGIYQGLTDPDFQLIGGSNYVKRAVYNTFEIGGMSATNFDQSVLLGNIASAQSYESYLANSAVINALVSAEPDSAFAAETAINLVRAVELGLTKRHRADWFGGFNALMEEGYANAGTVEFGFDYDPFSDQVSRLVGVGEYVLGDAIDIAGQTTIEVEADDTASQTIDLRSGTLADQTGFVVNGAMRDDVAHSGGDFAAIASASGVIAANALRMGAQVSALSDTETEANEHFRLTLGDDTGSYLQRGEATVTIADATENAHLMVGRAYATEADGHLVWRVSLSKAAGGAVSLDFALTADKAEAGVDYTETLEVSADGSSSWSAASAVTLAAGATEYFVRVAVTDDNTPNGAFNAYELDGEGLIIPGSGNGEAEFHNIEGNEYLTLSATVTAGNADLHNGNETVSGLGTIVDSSNFDTANPDPLVWVDDLVIHEGQTADINIARSRAAAAASNFTYTTADNRLLEIPVAATVDAGGGDDTVHASDLGDNIFGGEGNDTLYGGRLDDWLLGGDGNDTLDAGGATIGSLGGDGNYLNGGAGNDILQGREGSDWLEGGDGADAIAGGDGDDILTGGSDEYDANGNWVEGDRLYGGTGDDSYLLRLGDGSDIANESTVILNAQGQIDIDAQGVVQLDDFDLGGKPQGYDALFAQDDLTNPNGTNVIAGSYFDKQTIDGWYSNASGTNATFVQSRYAGIADESIRKDWTGYLTPGVTGQHGLGGGEDSVVLGQGIGIGDVRLKRSGTENNPGSDLIVQVMGPDVNGANAPTGDEITLRDWFTDPFKRIEWLKFADGNEIRIADITSFVVGTNGDNTLVGTAGNDFLYGGDGNDRLFLLAGDDIGSGGSGMDYVSGDSGADLVVGGSGADALTGGAGTDVLSGDGGNDDLYGGAGDDTISGGRGDDHLVGGAGNDVFKYSRGDGADTIFDEFAGAWDVVWERSGAANGGFTNGYTLQANGEIWDSANNVVRENIGTTESPQFQWVGRWDYDSVNETLRRYAGDGSAVDADGLESWRWDPTTQDFTQGSSSLGDLIEFAPGINIQDIVLRQSGDDLVMHITRDGGSSGIVGEGGDSITLKDWSLSPSNIERLAFLATGELDLTQTNILAGTDGEDTLTGTVGADWATGGTGDDDIDGGDGDDILLGNGGLDVIRGGQGNDVLYGGAGDDVLIGGANGTGAGDHGDILIGGAGSDWASYEDNPLGLIVSLKQPSRNTFSAAGDNYISIENLRGGAGNDQLAGDDFENILEGGDGADILAGGKGDDTYVWNALGTSDGSDSIKEGTEDFGEVYNGSFLNFGYVGEWVANGQASGFPTGYTEYVYTISDPLGSIIYLHSQPQIRQDGLAPPFDPPTSLNAADWAGGYDTQPDGSVTYGNFDENVDYGEDTIEFGEGIALGDLSIAWDPSGQDLQITHDASGETITIEGQLTDGGRVEVLQFHDGLSASLTNLNLSGAASAEGDFIFRSTNTGTIDGLAGDDVMFGGAGDGTLNGGDGDDTIEGGAGADTLDGGGNSADDGTNPLRGDTVSYRSSASGVTIDLRDQDGVATQSGGDAQGDILTGFENVDGSLAGFDVIHGDNESNRLFGFGGNDQLHGHGGDDVLVGGEGVDTVYGGDGDDNIAGEAGNDSLRGEAGVDLIDGGEGNDTILGGYGNDTVLGGAGNDTLRGDHDDDLIDGGVGDDTLKGGFGADRLIGGEGNDTLEGQFDDDLYLFGANDGSDTIVDTHGINTIAFDPSVSRDDLWITKSGDDLRIGVIGGDTVATVTGFFAASGASVIDRIQTADGQLLLTVERIADETDPDSLVSRMTAISAGSTPDAMDAALTDELDSYWDRVDGVSPRAPEIAQTVQVDNHGANAINLDDWPGTARTLKGENSVIEEGWPRDIDDVTGTPIDDLTGWGAWALGETEWHVADGSGTETDSNGAPANVGPYGRKVVTLRAGEAGDGDSGGGGLVSGWIDADSTKAYEFTWYFKRDEAAAHRLIFGPGNGSDPDPNVVGKLKNAVTGDVIPHPKFLDLSSAEQNANFVDDRWYKVVGYVLPENHDNIAAGSIGGVYDTLTGEKVYDLEWTFRWNENQTSDRFQSSASASGGGAESLNTHIYQPEIREIDPAGAIREGEKLDVWHDARFVGDATVEGWHNFSAYAGDGEARWKEVDGPDGSAIVALETGQFDATAHGGGNWTNKITIDPGKAYKYTQYVRKSDLTKHSLIVGMVGSKDALDTGTSSPWGYFSNYNSTQLSAALEEDKWYKLVGYVLPENTATTSEALGGIYDADTGAKLLDVDAYRWTDTGAPIEVFSWFYTLHDTAEHGFSTQFGEPTFAVVGDSLADVQADQLNPLAELSAQDNSTSAMLIDASDGVTDHDGDIASYALNPDGAPSKGTLELVDPLTGQVRYTPFAGELGEDSFSVVVSDAAGNQTVVPINVEIGIPGVNNAPDVPDGGFAVSIDENSSLDAVAGTLSTTDPDGDGGIDFMFARSLMTMVGGKYVTFSNDGLFRMERDYGKVVFNGGTDLDYETDYSGYSYDVRVTDKNSGLNSRASYSTLAVSVGDVNEQHALSDVSLDVNHYSKALGPFVPMPDEDGVAINLNQLMLTDPEGGYVSWAVVEVRDANNTVLTDHPWSIGPDGNLHLGGAIQSGQTYKLTVSATDADQSLSVPTAELTLVVGSVDGFVAHPTINQSFNFDFSQFSLFNSLVNLPPVVLDLDGDGVELVSFAASTARFDMDGDGNRDRTGWVGADDGLLAIDLNGDGIINDGSEISFQRFVDGAFSDLEGLAFFDTNNNGMLDGGDAQFGDFRVWQDVNQDGVSNAGELLTLGELGVESLSLSATLTGNTPGSFDNVIYANGTYQKTDGTSGALADTFLVFDPLSHLTDSPTTENPTPDNPETDNPVGGSDDTDGEPADNMQVARHSYSRKSGKFRAHAINGRLVVGPKNLDTNFDSRSGMGVGASMLAFSNRSRGYLTPIILDLDGDGVEMRGRKKSRAWFDMDGDGSLDNVGWTGKGDGFLVIDRNENGIIDDGSELSFAIDDPTAGSDLQALAALDSNGDGIISADDERFGELKVWVDANDNGRTDAGELRTLDQIGIASIGLAGQANSDRKKIGKNILLATSTFTRTDGSVGTVGDVALAFKPGSASSRSVRRTVVGSGDIGELTSPFNLDPFGRDFFESRFPMPDGIEQLQLTDDMLAMIEDLKAGLDGSSGTASSGQIDRTALAADDPFALFANDADSPGTTSSPNAVQRHSIEAWDVSNNPLFEELAGQDSAEAQRLALILQEMSAFGAKSGPALERERRGSLETMDYFTP